MKIQELSYLSIRVIAIILFLFGLNQCISVIQFTLPTYRSLLGDQFNEGNLLLISSIPSIVMIIVSIIIWYISPKLSKLLVQREARDNGNAIYMNGIEVFLISLLGLMLSIYSGTTLIRLIITYINSSGDIMTLNQQIQLASVIEQAIRLVLGILLLFKAEGFAMLLKKIRNAGLKK